MEKSKLNKANLLEIERPNEKQYRKSLRKVLIEKNYNNVYFARVGFNFNKLNSFFKNEKKTPQKIINIFLKINIFNEENIDAVIKNNLNEIIEYTQKLCNHFSIEILPTDNFPYPSILAIFNAEINNGDIKFTIKKNFYKIYSNNVEVTDEMKDLYKENYIKEVYNNNNYKKNKELESLIVKLLLKANKRNDRIYLKTMLRILRGNIKSNVAAKYSDEIFYNYASKISLTELNQIINNLIIEEIIDFDFGYGHELFYFISENAKYEEIIEDTRISLEDLIIEEILKRGKS